MTHAGRHSHQARTVPAAALAHILAPRGLFIQPLFLDRVEDAPGGIGRLQRRLPEHRQGAAIQLDVACDGDDIATGGNGADQAIERIDLIEGDAKNKTVGFHVGGFPVCVR